MRTAGAAAADATRASLPSAAQRRPASALQSTELIRSAPWRQRLEIRKIASSSKKAIDKCRQAFNVAVPLNFGPIFGQSVQALLPAVSRGRDAARPSHSRGLCALTTCVYGRIPETVCAPRGCSPTALRAPATVTGRRWTTARCHAGAARSTSARRDKFCRGRSTALARCAPPSARACSRISSSPPRSSGALRDQRCQGRELSISGARARVTNAFAQVDLTLFAPLPQPQVRSGLAAPELEKVRPVGDAPATAQWQDLSLAAVVPANQEAASPTRDWACIVTREAAPNPATSPVGEQVRARAVSAPANVDVAAVRGGSPNENLSPNATSAAPVCAPLPGPVRLSRG